MKGKKLCSIVLTLLLCLLFPPLPAPALGSTTDWTAVTGFASGETYYISSAEDLQAFAALVNSGNSGLDAAFVLTDDLDLSTVCGSTIGNWTPIGGSGAPFAGAFAGGDKTVQNLYIENAAGDYQGLFGYISGGSVDDLTVSGQITGNSYVGGIAGYMENGRIGACENTATVYANARYAGGIAGCMEDSAITDSVNAGHVHIVPTGEYEAGGIVGSAVGYSTESGERVYHAVIADCENSGPVINSEDGTGGIVGYLETGIVQNCSNSGSVTGVNGVGGIAGYVYCDSAVSDCTNSGTVTASEQYVGGIAGCVYALYDYADAAIEDCENTGSVTCSYTSALQDSYDCVSGPYPDLKPGEVYYTNPTGGCAGGIAGTLWLSAFTNMPGSAGSSASVSNCTNTGEVFNTNSATTGGIAGYVFNGSVAGCVNTATIQGKSDDTSVQDVIGYLFLTDNPVDLSGIGDHITVGGTDAAMTSVPYGQSYSLTLTADSGYTLTDVTVVMDGVDITASACSGGAVQIDHVTGTIAVSAAARISTTTGGSRTTSYPITVTQGENGSVTVSPEKSPAGGKVSVTAVPDAGWAVEQIVVTDKKSNVIDVTGQDGAYRFTTPVGGAWVTAVFQALPGCDGGVNCPAYGYTDVDTTQWYHAYVDYVIANGLMSGYSSARFGVNDNITREQLMVILHRLAGEPAVTGDISFADVPAGSYAYAALVWAVQNGLISGDVNGTLGAGDSLTREQIITIFYRYARYTGADVSVGAETNILSYEDALYISEYAIPAFQWACGAGLIEGASDRLRPQDTATRVQLAAIMMRFSEISLP